MEDIYYTSFETPLGTMWGAKSEIGLIKFSIYNTEEHFLKRFRDKSEFNLIKDKTRFQDLEALIIDYFASKPVEYQGPLDLRGTEFQVAIWNAVYGIPYGKLSSYGALAALIGKPKAYRAAGNAVGSNPCGLIIPCHRVIHSSGGLGGFGGGLGLKRKLLTLEGILPNAKEGVEKNVDLKDFFI